LAARASARLTGERRLPPDLILIVDDEPAIVDLARLYIEREGFRVGEAVDGEAALRSIESLQPALVVLDVMLPKLDGFEVCKRLRASGSLVPVLILTARDEDVDKIVGLELGADDYLTKPFNPRELVARVKAILRRGQEHPGVEGHVIRVGDLAVDTERREVWVADRLLDLRVREFELLAVLARQPGRVFSREQLLRDAWGYDYVGQTRTVDVHVAQVRKKMGDSAARIETVPGVGYKLTA
ncbi:MAG TPA: response regulator transcription factor, partial [Anaerolineales bacterium]|nr:response regulator transcription factor [Anaerolineales bacterium]